MASRKAKKQGGPLEERAQSRVNAALAQARRLGRGGKNATSAARYRRAREAEKAGRTGEAEIVRRQANAVAHDELSRKADRSIKKAVANKKAYDRAQKVKKTVNKAVKKVRGKK